MIYLLDTDHISLVDRGGDEGQRIRVRLSRVPLDDISVSVISYEEQIRGWIAVIAQARTAQRQRPFYREMERLLRFYCNTPMLPFDEIAVSEFERLQKAKVRIGSMDLKIASIALANKSILLTRNLADVGKVPASTPKTGQSDLMSVTAFFLPTLTGPAATGSGIPGRTLSIKAMGQWIK